MTNDFLESLCRTFGPTGCEEPVAAWIRAAGEALCSFCHTDRVGNVIFTYEPEHATEDTRTVMIAAHMDEVGFMINEIDDEGYLHFSLLGDVDPRALCGRNVTVGNERERVTGVIASKAIHHQTAEERAKITDPDDMYIDIGATSREEAEKHVSVGDFGTFYGHIQPFGEDRKYYHAKALDNRAGCAVLLEAMKRLAEGSLQSSHRLHFCFTVRGEAGPSGAGMAAELCRPDIAIIIDAATAADLPDVALVSRMAELKKGCVVPFADKNTVYAKALVETALSLAEEKGIAVQVKGNLTGGKDAAEIQKRGMGAEVLALSVPVRYTHTASSVMYGGDMDAVAELLSALLASPLKKQEINHGGQYV